MRGIEKQERSLRRRVTQKTQTATRNFEHANSGVQETYRRIYENQTSLFVRHRKQAFLKPIPALQPMTIAQVFARLNHIVDESDPDTSETQDIHGYQTGEALRERYLIEKNNQCGLKEISIRSLFSGDEWINLPEKVRALYEEKNRLDQLYPHIKDWSWLPLIGFIHDLGKVLALPEWGAWPQYAVVGDTFVINAPLAKNAACYSSGFFKNNSAFNGRVNLRSDTVGCYKKGCGFDNVDLTYGHDEYLYTVLNRTKTKLPPEALNIIRYHSFYAWHSGQGYAELATDADWQMLPLLKAFQKADLYSKAGEIPNFAALKAYYATLITRHMPAKIDGPWAEGRLRDSQGVRLAF